jgi:hypothetical protein
MTSDVAMARTRTARAGYTQASASCSACAAGKYKAEEGQAACINCVSSTYSSAPAAASASACQPCPPHASSPAGSSDIVACSCQLFVLSSSDPTHQSCLKLCAGVHRHVCWCTCLYRQVHQPCRRLGVGGGVGV